MRVWQKVIEYPTEKVCVFCCSGDSIFTIIETEDAGTGHQGHATIMG